MRKLLFFALVFCGVTSYAQNKYNNLNFSKLTEVEGTNYVIASVENFGKGEPAQNRYLLFIDTKTGQANRVEIPNRGYVEKMEQVKIDLLGINKIIVSARTLDLSGKNGIDWNDPSQIIILSTDGKERVQLTEDKLFVHTWTINKTTGAIVVTGCYDANNDGKCDKLDKIEVVIYDLKTLKLLGKLYE